MSRIYEALQRAEAERLSEREDNDHKVSVIKSSRDASPEPAVLQAATSTGVLEPPVSHHDDAASFQGSAVRECVWTISTEQLPALGRRGPAVEQFRSLRSRIQEFRAMNRLKSILVSSGVPQEGKSFIAANLAVSLALHKNNKVLLVDGDMRRSTLHKYFGTESRPGLSDYLAGRSDLLQVVQRPALNSMPSQALAPILNNLVLIPGGSGGDKAADLAGSSRFEELLREMGPHFDWIIVDSSPVLPVSDSVSMGRACDAVLLVARSGVTTFPVAQRAKHELKASNIIGYVLNAVKNPPALTGYYSYDSTTE